MVEEVAVRNISWAKLLTPDKRGACVSLWSMGMHERDGGSLEMLFLCDGF